YEGGVAEIAPGDQLALRMAREPALAVSQELLDLGVADPVVLLPVEDGDEDVELRQQLGQPARPRERDREVRARPEIKHGIEWMRLGDDVVAERSEKAPHHGLAPPARHDGELRNQRD